MGFLNRRQRGRRGRDEDEDLDFLQLPADKSALKSLEACLEAAAESSRAN